MDPFITALTHAAHLGTSESKRDVSVAWHCPKCQQVQAFVLIVTEAAIKVAGIELGAPAFVLDLRCVDCGYEFKVPSSEKDLVMQTRELTNALRTGSLSADVYVQKLRTMPAQFIREMIALTDEWSCPKCSEKNPANFDSCWNCHFNAHDKEAEVPEGGQPLSGLSRDKQYWEIF
jgi:hypothetical protein